MSHNLGHYMMRICFYTCKKISVEWGKYVTHYIEVNDAKAVRFLIEHYAILLSFDASKLYGP
jgi:hypothetical protein